MRRREPRREPIPTPIGSKIRIPATPLSLTTVGLWVVWDERERLDGQVGHTCSGRGAGARRLAIGGRAAPASVRSSSDGLTAPFHAQEEWEDFSRLRPLVVPASRLLGVDMEPACPRVRALVMSESRTARRAGASGSNSGLVALVVRWLSEPAIGCASALLRTRTRDGAPSARLPDKPVGEPIRVLSGRVCEGWRGRAQQRPRGDPGESEDRRAAGTDGHRGDQADGERASEGARARGGGNADAAG